MSERLHALLCWEAGEDRSWNPVLAGALRARGHEVMEAHGLEALEGLDPQIFDICLPRFRVGCATMACLDDRLVRSGIPMVNTRATRTACENKALAHAAFAWAEIPQPAWLVVDREGGVDRTPAWEGETVVKPLSGCRGDGIEILPSIESALRRATARREDLLLQEMIWPARSWRVIVGRGVGIVDPYWRRPQDGDRILSISAGALIARDPVPPAVEAVALEMLDAVGGDLLAADVLERNGSAWALEINHNFDAHGGDDPAVGAFEAEMRRVIAHASTITV